MAKALCLLDVLGYPFVLCATVHAGGFLLNTYSTCNCCQAKLFLKRALKYNGALLVSYCKWVFQSVFSDPCDEDST